MPLPRVFLLLALPLTFIVVVVGAFVRLSDAGLGCPDWPGCYGQLVGVAAPDAAQAAFPDSEYDLRKAWIEVGHRYIAGLLGILLFMAAVADWLARRRLSIVSLLLPLVLFQAILGMLTVTEKLKPVIVTAHLLGGLTILALAAAAVARRPLSVSLSPPARRRALRYWTATALFLLLQIILGGWVSTNYAGLACPDFPLCQGGWLPPQTDFSGFAPARDLYQTSDGAPISAAALATIHWLHRVGALLLALVATAFIALLLKQGARGEGIGLAVFLLAQIMLGIINVIYQLPMWAAVAHNAAAALLVVNIAVLGVKLLNQVPRPTVQTAAAAAE